MLQIADIDLQHRTITGGLKTDAGKNRIIPIHPAVMELVQKNYTKAKEINSEHLFNDENGQQGTWLTYDKYRGSFNKIMKYLNMNHKSHDTHLSSEPKTQV